MANVLKREKKDQVVALGRLGWSLRRIEAEVKVCRAAAAKALREAGISIRPARHWGRVGPGSVSTPVGVAAPPVASGAAFEDRVCVDPGPVPPREEGASSGSAGHNPAPAVPVSGDPALAVGAAETKPGVSPQVSHCEPHREVIERALGLGRNSVAIYQELVDNHGFTASYKSVGRFVRRLRQARGLGDEPCGIIETAPGEETQVDWGEGPMVRDGESGKYVRTRMFVLTLGYSRKSVRLLTFHSSSRIWAELHEQAFRRLGGVTTVVVLDNLKEGVLQPDIWDPTLNLLYAAMLQHYGVVGLPCRVRDPDRKGKVERAVGHAQGTALKGLRFESLAAAQAHLDHWEERWADTRIHGTTRRQVAWMFAEEKPHLLPLPVAPFRYFQYGTRTVHRIDGCVQVGFAYYEAPPGLLGQDVSVQWDDMVVRILSRQTGQLLVEHPRKLPGKHSLQFEQQSRTPPRVQTLLNRAHRAGKHIGALCQSIHVHEGIAGVRRIQGVLGLAKRHGMGPVDEICCLGLHAGVPTYKFVKHYLEHHPPSQLLAKIDPIIRDLSHYRDVIRRMTGETP